MKVGTVPKITVGAAALAALIFIGYIGIRQMNASLVEERVYLSPWEDGAARPQNNPVGLAAQIDSAQDTESGDTQPQIDTADSAEGMESIDEFFSQSEETDMGQFATEVEFELNADQTLSADTSTLLDGTGQAAEDVMYAYVESVKNLDSDAMRSLVTEEFLRRGYHNIRGNIRRDGTAFEFSSIAEIPAEILAEIPAETLDFIKTTTGAMRKSVSQTEVVSSEYLGDEFHFQLRIPAPEMPEISGVEVETTSDGDLLFKMRRIDGVWRIYDGGVN